MAISEEKLKEIEEWAFDLMSMEQTAKIVQVPWTEFKEDPAAQAAFETGQLKALASINGSIRKLAAAGSGPAQEMALNLIENQNLKSSFQ